MGMDVMFVLGENEYGAKPTAATCKSYAEKIGASPENFYVDFDYDNGGSWATSFQNIFPYLSPDGAFYLPWDAVLDGANMEYVYSSSIGPHSSAQAAVVELMYAD